MENIINRLIKQGIGNVIDKTRDEILLKDEEYLQDDKDLRELEERYMNLELNKNQRYVVNDYIACLESARAKCNDASYFAGIKDTILLLNHLGLLKDEVSF